MSGTLIISDDLVECYKLFQVADISKNISNLSRKEQIILFLLILENYSEWNTTSLNNFRTGVDVLQLIYKIQIEEFTDYDADIEFLANKTGNKFIDTASVIDRRGHPIPEPLTKEEIFILKRAYKIDTILE